MYDNVRSSYKPFGEDFYGQNQTKEIEEGYGGTMSQYWISPEGQLYLIDTLKLLTLQSFKKVMMVMMKNENF